MSYTLAASNPIFGAVDALPIWWVLLGWHSRFMFLHCPFWWTPVCCEFGPSIQHVASVDNPCQLG